MAGPAAGDLVTVTTYGRGQLANGPVEGYILTGIKPEVISVVDVDGVASKRVVLKAFGIRPAQKGQKELVMGITTEVEDPTPVCLGELLVVDKATAIALCVVFDLTADAIA